jgi:prepilin-type N-terminal cleavage/methylation domain-containing protein
MNKRGYSLTELLVVMSMTSMVLTAGMGMVHRVMHEQKSVDRNNAMHRVAERLSTQLREDVHGASRADVILADDNGEQRLVLYHPGERTVTYTVRNNALQRAAICKSEPTRHDSFQFPDNYHAQFFDSSAQRVTFTVFAHWRTYLAAAHDNSPTEDFQRDVLRAVMHVEASVGRNRRFANETRKRTEP